MRIWHILFSLIFLSTYVFSQQANVDWKFHNVGRVEQIVTNKGALWDNNVYSGTLYNCKFPPGSIEEHIGEAGMWVGAITPEGDTLVSVSCSWNPHRRDDPMAPFEFWPTEAEWDTIWVINRGDTVDIPYWLGYVGMSDQDFVCRYNDYTVTDLGPISQHRPLYVDVIQVSHAWSSPAPINDIILVDYYIIPKQFDLKKAYFSVWADPNIGNRFDSNGRLWGINNFLQDDYSIYFYEYNLAMGVDAKGGIDGDAFSPIAYKVILPRGAEPQIWSFNWSPLTGPPGVVPAYDADKYSKLMCSGNIMGDQQVPTGSHFVLSFGPYNIALGDTFHYRVVEILGEGVTGVLKTAEFVDMIAVNDFQLPAPPPMPPLRVKSDNHRIKLNWEPTDKINPEIYRDPNRADGSEKPFEGYRVYKSFNSKNGPWKLIAEFDIAENGIANDIGLEREFTDVGLLNNVEYFYSVTAFSKEDKVMNWPSLESSIDANAVVAVPGTEAPDEVGMVAVVPNPYRGDVNYNSYIPPWEKPIDGRQNWIEQDRRIQFINLPEVCTIKIFTLTGDLVQVLKHNESGTGKGYHDWNLTSSVGQAVASGLYLFVVQNEDSGESQVGKFVIIK